MRLLPRVFVASSSEAIRLAKAIKQNLKDDAEVRLWEDDLFRLGKTVVHELVGNLPKFDFAIFVFHPDDQARIRGNTQPAVRDNVVFELGIFMGGLGPDRTFIVRPEDDLRLPSDLLGVIYAPYDGLKARKRPALAMRKICRQISREIVTRHKERANEIELVVRGGLQTACRLMGIPKLAHTAGLRVFVFRHELGNPSRHREGVLTCWSFYDPDDSKEKAGTTWFPIHRKAAKRFVVVKSFRDGAVVGLPVKPVPTRFLGTNTRIKSELQYVLAAPIKKGELNWGTVNFDASNDQARRWLEGKAAQGVIKRLAAHLSDLLLQ